MFFMYIPVVFQLCISGLSTMFSKTTLQRQFAVTIGTVGIFHWYSCIFHRYSGMSVVFWYFIVVWPYQPHLQIWPSLTDHRDLQALLASLLSDHFPWRLLMQPGIIILEYCTVTTLLKTWHHNRENNAIQIFVHNHKIRPISVVDVNFAHDTISSLPFHILSNGTMPC